MKIMNFPEKRQQYGHAHEGVRVLAYSQEFDVSYCALLLQDCQSNGRFLPKHSELHSEKAS